MQEDMTVPGHVPLPVHHQVDVLDATAVGIVQPLGKVLLQVRLEVLLGLFTLHLKRKK